MEKIDDKNKEMKLIIEEGEPVEQQVKEGTMIKDVQKQVGKEGDTELLQSIDKKLDMLLAAQDIR